jgi:predicted glycosyltransferase involved in capsule biosynthesis
MVPGKFEKGTIQKVVRADGETTYEVFELKAFFEYGVNDEVYRGEYTEDFQVLSHAQQLLRSLENGPLYVRYNPTKPWDHGLDPYRDVRSRRETPTRLG